MKLKNLYRYSCGANSARDGLSQAALLSGNPVLERGIDVMAEADPLRLLVHAKRGVAKPAVRGDHAAPERQAFSPLPVVPAYPSGSGGGDA